MKWLKDKKLFSLILLAELLLLLAFGGIALFRENKMYDYEPSAFTRDGEYMNSAPIRLPRGIYQVILNYDCEGTMRHFCTMESMTDPDSLSCSGEHLSEGLGATNFTLWVKAGGTDATMRVHCGEGALSLKSLQIRQTDQDLSRTACQLLLLFLSGDLLWVYRLCNGRDKISREQKLTFWGMCTIILVSSFPLFTDCIYPGSDITYHLLRIGNLKEGLAQGQFPVRIDPAWLYGHGYASSVCYGDIFLYLPALLRLLGFTLQESYACFLFLLNTGACLISYFSFKNVFRDRWVALLGSAVYTLSLYRLFKQYSWGALGEAQSILFLPLILCAVYRIFSDDIKSKSYNRLWIPLGAGFACIIQCHILTVEITAFFLAAACVVLWKRLIRPKTLLVFLKGVLFASAISAWFLIPFLDYYFHVNMVIHQVSARTIQEGGLYPANFLFAFFQRGSVRDLTANGLIDMQALGIGLPLTAAALGILLLWFFGCLKKKSPLTQAAKLAMLFGGCAITMSLSCFPWNRIQFLNGILEKLVSSIQYPNRFLMIATVLLTFEACVCTVVLGDCFGKKAKNCTLAVFAGMTLVTSLFYLGSIVRDSEPLYLYDESGMGTGYLSGGEYLRYGVDQSELSFHGPIAEDGVEVLDYRKEGLAVDLELRNRKNEESYVEIPLQHYKGYEALSDSGERLELTDGSHFDIRIRVPGAYQGRIKVRFRSPWYWRLGEAVSLVTLLGVFLGYLLKIKKCK